MRRPTLLFLVFIFAVLFFITYNLLTVTIHYNKNVVVETVVKNSSNHRSILDPVVKMPKKYKTNRKDKRLLFHVALTSTSSPYSKWQSRIMYYWYKKKRNLSGSEMGDFTRILHSGNPDNLMDEIPTMVVDPLPNGLDKGYVVLNRPWAFFQWLKKANIKEKYILMAEPDHIFINPLPNLSYGDFPVAFHFQYIEPINNEKILRKYFPVEKGPVTNIDPIGSSPVIIKKDLLEKIVPTWVNISLMMKHDLETDQVFGWVLEMYAYAVASALQGVTHILHKDFMLEPPFDLEIGKKYIIHYTFSCDYNMKGDLTYGKIGEWRFDKRAHLDGPPPKNISMPPPGVPQSVVTLVKMLNEASANLPNWEGT